MHIAGRFSVPFQKSQLNRPLPRGHVHPGIFKSARLVVESVMDRLQDALQQAPGLPILVTGTLTGQ